MIMFFLHKPYRIICGLPQTRLKWKLNANKEFFIFFEQN